MGGQSPCRMMCSHDVFAQTLECCMQCAARGLHTLTICDLNVQCRCASEPWLLVWTMPCDLVSHVACTFYL